MKKKGKKIYFDAKKLSKPDRGHFGLGGYSLFILTPGASSHPAMKFFYKEFFLNHRSQPQSIITNLYQLLYSCTNQRTSSVITNRVAYRHKT